MTQTSDVLIIGAGIAGTSVASELAADLDVTVLEMEDRPGYHSTGRSAAMWIPTYGPQVIRALTVASGPLLKDPPAEFSETPLTEPRSEMVLGLHGDEAETDALKTIGMQEVAFAEASARIPPLRAEAIATVLLDDTTREIDVDALHQSFIKKLRRQGGTIVCHAAAQAIARKSGHWQVSTKTGDFEAPVIINAAGAWADEVATLAGLQPIGIQPKRRSVAIVPVPPEISVDPWPVVISSSESFYFKPQSGKLLISPADETPVEPHDAWADDMALAEAIDRFQSCVDIEVTRVEHTWGGLRTFSPDGDPIAGFDSAADGFFWLAGQGGYGIQTSPALSRVAAALIRGKDIPDDIVACGVSPDQLSPVRF